MSTFHEAKQRLVDHVVAHGCDGLDPDGEPCGKCLACAANAFLEVAVCDGDHDACVDRQRSIIRALNEIIDTLQEAP